MVSANAGTALILLCLKNVLSICVADDNTGFIEGHRFFERSKSSLKRSPQAKGIILNTAE